MIKVYFLDCSPLFDSQELASVLPCLDEARRTKTLRLQTPERRAQSAGAGLLLRHLFGEAEYIYGKNGKPYLKGTEALYFSISHSDRYVVCAVADCEVGIDIEPASPIRPEVLRRCFTENEQNWIGEDPEKFARLWTMKEAYMKMTGTGLSVPAKKIELPIPPTDGCTINKDGYCFFFDTIHPISVCSKKNNVKTQIQNLLYHKLLYG